MIYLWFILISEDNKSLQFCHMFKTQYHNWNDYIALYK